VADDAMTFNEIQPQEQLMPYVDGFVIPVPEKNIAAYRKMAAAAGKVWMEHGALQYRECVGDELAVEGMAPWAKTIKLKPGETLVFSWISYKSKTHRNQVNKKVMKDPRMNEMMEGKKMPFDMKRMLYGGFNVLVDL
jgi:uncharacterized protein YbaA (DUF1428 family)